VNLVRFNNDADGDDVMIVMMIMVKMMIMVTM
jgi:hypothetical protein